jgi:hypothetical protein
MYCGRYDYHYYDSGEYGEAYFVVRHRIVNPRGYVVFPADSSAASCQRW